jgi:hypothetical protein
MQSETKEIDVFKKNIGMNNEEMWKQCELLKSVAFQTIESKSGKGKNVRIVKEYKHNIPSEVMDRISNSCEYYKNLYEKEMKNRKIGSLEVIKYRFEKIDGEPKIIIDMIKVLDENGCYIKFAKLEKVLNFLSKYPIKFKDNVRT